MRDGFTRCGRSPGQAPRVSRGSRRAAALAGMGSAAAQSPPDQGWRSCGSHLIKRAAVENQGSMFEVKLVPTRALRSTRDAGGVAWSDLRDCVSFSSNLTTCASSSPATSSSVLLRMSGTWNPTGTRKATGGGTPGSTSATGAAATADRPKPSEPATANPPTPHHQTRQVRTDPGQVTHRGPSRGASGPAQPVWSRPTPRACPP